MKERRTQKCVLTIRESVRRCHDEGYPLSEYRLRKLVKSNAIPYRQIGNKILIYYPNLMQYFGMEV